MQDGNTASDHPDCGAVAVASEHDPRRDTADHRERGEGEPKGASDIVEQVRVRDCRRYRCRPYRHARPYYRDPRVPLAPYGGWYSGHWDPKVRRGDHPKARLLLEGSDASALEQWSHRICGKIKEQIGA